MKRNDGLHHTRKKVYPRDRNLRGPGPRHLACVSTLTRPSPVFVNGTLSFRGPELFTYLRSSPRAVPFVLAEDDRAAIDAMDTGVRSGPDPEIFDAAMAPVKVED